MKNDFVNVVGRIPAEVFEKIQSGELVFNNGLRNAKGPASFYPKQPELWIQDSSADYKSATISVLINIGLPILLKQGLPILMNKIDELDFNELIAEKKLKEQEVAQRPTPNKDFDSFDLDNIISLDEYRKASNH